MILPFLIIYFSNFINAILIGITLICGVLIRVVGSFVGGFYADKRGRKKLIIVTEVLLFIAYLIFLVSKQDHSFLSMALQICSYLLIHFSLGAYDPAIEGMVLDVTSPDNRKLVYGVFYWIYNLSVSIGGIIGGLLFSKYLDQLIIFTLTGYLIITFITFLFIEETNNYFDKKENKVEKLTKIKDLWISYKYVFADKLFMYFILASLLIISVEFHLNNYIGVRLEKEHLMFFNHVLDGALILGLLKTENTVLVVLSVFFIRLLTKQSRDMSIMFYGFILYISGFSILSYTNSVLLLFLAMFFATVGEVIFTPIRQTYMAKVIPNSKRSSYMAIHGLIKSGSLLFASVVLILSEYASRELISIIIFIVGLSGIFLFYFVISKINTQNET